MKKPGFRDFPATELLTHHGLAALRRTHARGEGGGARCGELRHQGEKQQGLCRPHGCGSKPWCPDGNLKYSWLMDSSSPKMW